MIYVEWSSVLCAFWFDVFILNDLSHLTYFDLYLCMWCKPGLLQPSKRWWSAFEVSSSETGQFAGLFCSLGLCQLSNGSASLTYMVKELWYVFGLCFRPFVKVLAVQNFFFFVHHQTPSGDPQIMQKKQESLVRWYYMPGYLILSVTCFWGEKSQFSICRAFLMGKERTCYVCRNFF